MAPPRKDLSFDAYLRSTAATTSQPPAKPVAKDLSYDAYLKQKEPSFIEKAGAVASGIMDAPKQVMTQTIARLSGIGKSEEEKRQLQEAADLLAPIAPKGKAGELYQASRGYASLPVEIAKYAAVGAIPVAGVPLSVALGAGEAAGGLKEESSAALARTIAEKTGLGRTAKALTPVVESELGRAAFDVLAGKALEYGVRGGVGGYKAGREFFAKPQQVITDANRLLPSSTSQTVPIGAQPAPTTGPVQGPAIPTGAPRVPETRPERLLPERSGYRNTLLYAKTIPFGAEPAPVTGALQGPAIPSPAGVSAPEGAASTLMRLLAPQSEALRQRQFQMPPAYGPFPLPEGAMSVRGPATSLTPQIPAQAASLRQRLFMMPPASEAARAVEAVESAAPAAPRVGRRPSSTALLPPEGLAYSAEPKEIAKYLKQRDKYAEIAKGFDKKTVARRMGETAFDEAEAARMKGGEPPAGYEDIPVEAFDELTYPDKSPRIKDSEMRNAELMGQMAGQPSVPTSPKVLAKLPAQKIQSMIYRASMQAEKALADADWYDTIGLEIREAGGSMRPEKGKKGAIFYNKYNEKVIDENGKQLVSPADLRRNGMYTEDELGYAFDRHGLDSEAYHEMQVTGERAAKSLAKTQDDIARLEGELARRQYTPEQMQNRPGFSASPITGALGGFGVGATTGAATDEEGGMSPLQRALLYGAAGAAGGSALMRSRAGREVVTPSIPELAPIAETINIGKRAPAPDAPAMLGRLERAYNNIVSETYALEKATKKFGTPEQGKVLPQLVAQQQGSRRAAEAYLEDNLTPLISGLSKAEKDNVRALLKARRELQILQQGGAAKSTTPIDVLERAVQAGNADAKIAGVADQITGMHRNLLAMRYQAGLLTDEAYQAIKASDDFYTPFFREAAQDPELAGMIPQRSGGFNILGTGVKKMDRTAEALEQTADPLETVIVDAARTYRDVARQRVSNVVFSIADKGDLPFLERIKADPMNPPKGEGIIQQMRNGKLQTYKVKDKDLYNALAGQDAATSNIAVKLARKLKEAKTAGITIMLDFSAGANVIRDVALSGIQRPDTKRALIEAGAGAAIGGGSRVYQEEGKDPVKNFLIGAGLGAGAGLYARPFAETMAAVKSIVLPKGVTVMGKQLVEPDNLFREFLADGGSTEGFFVRNSDDAARILKRLEKEPGFSRDDIINPKNWWETLRKIGSIGEQSTRVAAYRQLKEAGATGAEAALGAQDRTLRFANIGASTKGLAAVTPFWNAKIQGWDKLGRMITGPDKYKTAALGAGMLTAPSIALWSINKDNPEYWDRPIYERNLFWLVPKNLIGDEGEKGFYRIPKPFEIGYLFASFPERMLDYFTQAGVAIPNPSTLSIEEVQSAAPTMAEPGKALSRAAKEMATSTFEGTIPVPEIASLPAQLVMNKDFFRDRPIVSRPQLSPELQVTEETSTIARALAKAGVSPEKTDFFIRNAFGTAGAEASKVVDIAARAAGLPAPEAKVGMAGIPLIGRFSERFTTSNKGQTDPEALARERLRELNQIETDFREYKRLAKSENPKDRNALLDFVQQNEADLRLTEKIQPIETELEKLSRLRTEVRKDPRFSPEERRAALEILRERGQELSKALIGVRKP